MLATVLASCGAPAGSAGPTRTLPEPAQRAAATAAVDRLAGRLHHAIAADTVASLLFDDQALRALLRSEAAGRASVLRLNASAHLSVPEAPRALLGRTSYAGACVQELRDEAAGGPGGLRAAGWAFHRILVVGREPGGGHVATWVEGQFVYSDAGFGAVVVERVETPRRDHSDLEIATCDLRVGID